MIILDTMVLSEPLRPNPDSAVINWLDDQLPGEIYTTAINQAEMEYGLWALPQGKKRGRLHNALTELFEVEMKGRILPFDSMAAHMFGGHIAAVRQRLGKDAVKDMDGMIAAIAISNNRCQVATRDEGPFRAMGVDVINPWD